MIVVLGKSRVCKSQTAVHKLKILLISNRFQPHVGGVETVTRLLAAALIQLGNRVSIITRETLRGSAAFDFVVLRHPGQISLFRQCHTADAVIVQGLAIRLSWPLLWKRSGALIVHHMKPLGGEDSASGWIRAQLALRVRHAAVSKALAAQLPWAAEAILPNPYDAETFRIDPAISRTRDIIFVGRLITAKGASVLIEALATLRRNGKPVTATIVGEGPERGPLERECGAAGLEKDVQFTGQVIGSRLALVLNQHRLMVVPSLGHEAFGVVALEGIACGCAVIGSDSGGLPEAIGPCGTTFPTGNAESLAANIQNLLKSEHTLTRFRSAAEKHLAPHRPLAVARRYLELLVQTPFHSCALTSIHG